MIGNWDNSRVVFGILPACYGLVSGSKIASTGLDNLAYFPVYNGLQCSQRVTGLLGYSVKSGGEGPSHVYDTGVIRPPIVPDEFTTSASGPGPQSTYNYHFNWDLDITDFTIEMWITWHDPPAHLALPILQFLFYAGPNDLSIGNSIRFYKYTSANKFYFQLRGDNSTYGYAAFVASGVDEISEGNLYHICLIKSGTDIKIYINGNEVTYSNYRAVPVGNNNMEINTDIYLGNPPVYYPCYVDYHSVILYNKGFSETEVLANYALGTTYGGAKGYYDTENRFLEFAEEKSQYFKGKGNRGYGKEHFSSKYKWYPI